jgi:hypothetical protein
VTRTQYRPPSSAPDGAVQLYLNATPRQGTESLRQWAAFRLTLLRSDDAATAHEITAAEGVKFRGGTGSCVIDNYVTRTGEHHYEEIACLRARLSARCCRAFHARAVPASADRFDDCLPKLAAQIADSHVDESGPGSNILPRALDSSSYRVKVAVVR